MAPMETGSRGLREECLARRLAATAAVLSLCAGNVSVGAGWQSTPEARMVCCTNGTSYPMHKSESRGSDSKYVVSQVQADSWCAAACTRTQSSTADPAFVLSNSTALPALVSLVVPVAVGVPAGLVADSRTTLRVCDVFDSTRSYVSVRVGAKDQRNCVRTVSHTPETRGKHRDLRGHSDAHHCCLKSLMESALVRVGVRY